MQTNLSSEDRLANRLKTSRDAINRIIQTELWFWAAMENKTRVWEDYADDILYKYGWTYAEFIRTSKWK